MTLSIIGNIIKEKRKELKIAIKDLCQGLCSQSSLSRIENGEQIPSRKLAEALTSRMGIEFEESEITMTEIEKTRMELEEEFVTNFCSYDFNLNALIEKYKSIGEIDFLEEQTLLLFTAVFNAQNSPDNKFVFDTLKKSLLCTQSFDVIESDFNDLFFSTTELSILINMALCLHSMKKSNEAISLMLKLKNYYDMKPLDENQYCKNMPSILFNLSNWLGQSGEYEISLKFSEEGIELCKNLNALQFFSKFIFNKGYSLCKLKDLITGKIHLQNAFKIMKLTENPELPDLIPQVNKEFGFNFEI